MKDTYSLGQIMFALREEYIKVQGELDELVNKYIVTNDMIENKKFYLNAYGINSEEKTIMLCLDERRKLIERMLSKLGERFYPQRRCYSYNLTCEVKEEYHTFNGGVATIENIDKLQQEIKRIFDLCYSKNLVSCDNPLVYPLGKKKNI